MKENEVVVGVGMIASAGEEIQKGQPQTLYVTVPADSLLNEGSVIILTSPHTRQILIGSVTRISVGALNTGYALTVCCVYVAYKIYP